MLTMGWAFIRDLVSRHESGQDVVGYVMLGGAVAFLVFGLGVLGLTEQLLGLGSGVAECVDLNAGSDCF
jgi:hypothetical protein